MTRILYQEFRDELAETRYPFDDAARMTSTDGFVIPAGAFADGSLFPIGAVAPLWLANVAIAPHAITLTIKDAKKNTVAVGTLDPTSGLDTINIVDTRGRPAGVLVIDPAKINTLTAWSAGDHPFAQTAAPFVPTVTIPAPARGVAAILDEVGAAYDGEIWLVGGEGIVLTPLDAHTIRVDVVGDPLFAQTLCEPLSLYRTPNPIRTINHCAPDAYGRFQLAVDTSEDPATPLRINPTDDGVAIGLAAGGGPNV